MITVDALFQNPLYVAVTIIIIFVIYFVIRRAGKMPYVAQDSLLTKSELHFYNVLKRAVPSGQTIMMKVRMADIITCTNKQWHAGWGPRISAKHIDFVLIDSKTTEIICAIELDDSTHRTHYERIARDKFVNKAFNVAGVRLLRIPTERSYNIEIIKRMIAEY